MRKRGAFMRRAEIQDFAKKLGELEDLYGVVIHSSDYHTCAVINDAQGKFSYCYNAGKVELDQDTFHEDEDIQSEIL